MLPARVRTTGKRPLRADATRRALTEFLGGIDGIEEISADADSGSALVTGTLHASAPADTAEEAERRAGDFAVACRIVPQHQGEN